MIKDRPQSLASADYYNSLPELPVMIDRTSLPELLKFDLFDLVGLLPLTREIFELYTNGVAPVQPNEAVLRHHDRNGTRFVMVNVIANCYSYRRSDGIVHGLPYAVTILPSSKRGEIDYADARAAAVFDLENMPTLECVYGSFNPFTGEWGFFGKYGHLFSMGAFNKCFTDSIGFVIGTYFLADRFEHETVALPNLMDAPPQIARRYWRWRVKRYFSSFPKPGPRRVWGVSSPIELFLLQGLAARGVHTIPQYLIYESGDVFPSFHDMIYEGSAANETRIVTEADFYFPDQRLAVFCDSQQHHRSKRSQTKDQKITSALEDLGIRALRIPGGQIVHDLACAVDTVLRALQG